MIPANALKIIRSSTGQLVKPVKLVVFTKDTGCEACQSTIDLARAIKAHFSTLALEICDIIMDRDQAELFNIQRVPALVVQGGEGQAVTFYGATQNMMLEVLMNTILAVSTSKRTVHEEIRRPLQRLNDDVMIRVLVSDDSLHCKSVTETAISLALASDRVHITVVLIKNFPELVQKYDITVLPLTIFGENIKVAGDISEVEILKNTFEAQGIKPEPDSRCLACGRVSKDIICSTCKTKIQAEALEHKLKQEKQKQPEMP
jgi:hypothetical protein